MAVPTVSIPCLNKTEFLRSLECQYGLLDQLLESGCLTEFDVNDLKQRYRTEFERNKDLIKRINPSNVEKFEQGLEKTNQRHLANFIRKNGIRGSPDDCEWPLSPSEISALQKCHTTLVEGIYCPSLSDHLYTKLCISIEHKSEIFSKHYKEAQNRQLLDIITKRSIKEYKIFKDCLAESGHEHLLEVLVQATDECVDAAWPDVVEVDTTDSGKPAGSKKITSVNCIRLYNPIKGVTVVKDKIYLIQEYSSFVNVYKSDDLSESRDIKQIPMKRPVGLTGCVYSTALYIIDSDEESPCVHKYKLIDKTATSWPLDEDYWPWGISMKADHKLLVTVQVKGGNSKIVEYKNDGQKVREIDFHESVRYASKTLSTLNDEYIVCHGFGNSLQRICVTNLKGDIIKFYGGDNMVAECQLGSPKSLAIDSNNGHIFVADCHKDRVLLLNNNLNQLELKIPDDVTAPIRLHFDTSNNRLFIGEKSGRLLVISFAK